jgi:uncharacterized protein (TIGR02246 family)
MAVAVVLVAGGTAQAQPAITDSEAAAIRDVVRRYVEAREARSREGLEALFADDADQLVSSGEWRRGRSEVVAGGLASSARAPGKRTITVETIRLLAPDVVVADGRYEIGTGAEARRMWTTFVLVREQGEWRISAIRNMLPAAPAAASAPPHDPSEEAAILAVIDRFMQAVSTNDNALLAEIRLPDTMSFVERPAAGGGTQLARRPFDLSSPGGNYRERYWDPVVHVRNGIAIVWTPYEFWRDDTTSHCGIDVFELVKQDGTWRLANMMWTVEPDACEALRPSDPSRVRPQP